MSIEARQIQETLYSYAAILNFTPSPQGLRAKFGACSVQNAQLFTAIIVLIHGRASVAGGLETTHLSVCSDHLWFGPWRTQGGPICRTNEVGVVGWTEGATRATH